jgi:hypothetical protein
MKLRDKNRTELQRDSRSMEKNQTIIDASEFGSVWCTIKGVPCKVHENRGYKTN